MSQNKFLFLLEQLIKENLNGDITTDFLAKELNISRMHLHRRVKGLTGMSASEYMQSIKMREAKKLLLDTQRKVKDIAKSIGYTDSSYFSKVFKKETKHKPREYRMKYSVYYR